VPLSVGWLVDLKIPHCCRSDECSYTRVQGQELQKRKIIRDPRRLTLIHAAFSTPSLLAAMWWRGAGEQDKEGTSTNRRSGQSGAATGDAKNSGKSSLHDPDAGRSSASAAQTDVRHSAACLCLMGFSTMSRAKKRAAIDACTLCGDR